MDAAELSIRAVRLFSCPEPIEPAVLVECVDLTTLEGTDTDPSVRDLARRGLDPAGDGSLPSVAAVCVYPRFVSAVADVLADSSVRVASVAGAFPSGQSPTAIKVAEIERALADGADEVDIVLRYGDLLAGDDEAVIAELQTLREAASVATLKVILETGVLRDPELIHRATLTAALCGADFIKTSTGKAYTGATPEAVVVIAQTLADLDEPRPGVKVSGGVRSIEAAAGYATILRTALGPRTISPEHFRIGASSLLDRLAPPG